MDEPTKTTASHSNNYPDRHELSHLPIRQDAIIETSAVPGEPEKLQIEAIKPVYHPAEIISEPIKSYWVWVWIIVVLVVVIAWAILFWYFSNHQAPYSAPIGVSAVLGTLRW